jgi:glycosyltransferase involved in cell wall biosynthesis
MLKGRDIICLSTQDWNGLWTRKQRFMQMFAQAGNRVLYVETPVHLLGLDVLPGDPGRVFRFLRGPRPIEKNLFVATLPILMPFFQMSHTINWANHILIRRVLAKWIGTLGFRKPLIWLYTPFSEPLLNGMERSGTVYECVDEFRAARGLVRAGTVGAMEDALLRKVDVTIVTQDNLLARRRAICANTFCVPNGADTALFGTLALDDSPAASSIAELPRPRLGFVGHIQYWIDLSLIGYLAAKRPEWSLVLIGPVAPLANRSAVKGLPNVYFLGRKPQTEIPALLKGMDVCLNPYFTGELANHCSPLKLYEYLAAGKPIVSTDMPEALKFPEDVRVAGSHEDFLRCCDEVLRALPEKPDAIAARIHRASRHSWRNRFLEVNDILETHLAGIRKDRESSTVNFP